MTNVIILSLSDFLITKVLLATDGSESSTNALKYSLGFLPSDVKLIIISVMPELVKKELETSLKSLHEKIVQDAKELVNKKRPDLNIHTVVDEGITSDVICYYANDENVDMVIMGSRGLGGVKGFLLGSVSRNVVNACSKPILIVK
jgi:nucleotide-binding universal stress UspA family protein